MLRIPRSQLFERIAKTRAIMKEAGAKALLVYGGPARQGGGGTLQYLVGWAPPGASSALIVPLEGDLLVVSAGPNVTRVFNQRVAGFGAATAYAGSADFAAKIVGALQSVAAGGQIATYGANEMNIVLHSAVAEAFPQRIALDKPLADLRLMRSAEEVAMHQYGADISVEMIKTAMEVGSRQGATPADIMIEVERKGRTMGAENSGLWLATGERPPTTYFELFELNDSIGANDRIQLGATLSYEGHFAQCLRTGVLGKPSQALLDCTARLVEMQDKALAALVPGQPLSRLSDVIEAEIDAFCPYERTADPFRFQSCHALGVNYAEPSCASVLNAARDKSKDGEGPLVAENMVIEIHPNFTLPDLGHVCIGDMALVTATGAKWITNYPRELVRLD